MVITTDHLRAADGHVTPDDLLDQAIILLRESQNSTAYRRKDFTPKPGPARCTWQLVDGDATLDLAFSASKSEPADL
jgi:hypothetical protein